MKCSIGSLVALLLTAGGCGTYHFGNDAGSGGDVDMLPPAGDDGGGVTPTGDGGALPERACGTTFTFHGAAPATVSVAGELNSWDPT